MAIDRRLSDQVYDDRKHELHHKGWDSTEITRQIDKEFKIYW